MAKICQIGECKNKKGVCIHEKAMLIILAAIIAAILYFR